MTHGLKRELAAKVREAFLTFDFKGTKLEELLRGSHTAKFVPIDYKKDWEVVLVFSFVSVSSPRGCFISYSLSHRGSHHLATI